MTFSPQQLLPFLTAAESGVEPANGFCVGFSGGMDSTVLLAALAAIRDQLPPLRVCHVHHGLHEDADAWAAHCQRFCVQHGIDYLRCDVAVDQHSGQGVEASAREARYAAFANVMQPGEVLLTAHHADDQAETVLLRLLRSSGVDGLAAMRPRAAVNGVPVWRPLLAESRHALRQWADVQGLTWCEDASNTDEAFDRNYLRQQVMPRLQHRWGDVGRRFADSAALLNEASDSLSLLLDDQLAVISPAPDVLLLSGLQAFDRPRQRLLLRRWCRRNQFDYPPRARLDEFICQLDDVPEDKLPELVWGEVSIRRYRDALYLVRLPEAATIASIEVTPEVTVALAGGRCALIPEGRIAVPDGARLELRFRQGGEALRPFGRDGTHRLKSLFQEHGVLPWMRGQLPLLYVDGQLAAVADRWVSEAFACQDYQDGFRLRWEPVGRVTSWDVQAS